jgi:Flp pilus assembly protein TadD
MSGDLGKAVSLEEKAVALAPQTPAYWNQLAHFYDLQGRTTDGQKAAEKAAAVSSGRAP